MAKNYHDITLALAGICQSATLVTQLAEKGSCDQQSQVTMLNSILITDSPSTLVVFGGHESCLRLGVQSLLSLFERAQNNSHTSLIRYTLNLIVLERKLNANRQALNQLSERLAQIERQRQHFDIDSPTIISALAAIYVDIISPLGAKIQIVGTSSYLQNTLIQDKIRALLLAGIRCAVLWQQVGGGRLNLMFSRRRICQQAELILKHC